MSHSFNIMQLKDYTIPLVLALIVTAIGLIGSSLENWLRYDRIAILSGQVWRMFTAHVVHMNWSHLSMNVLGLGVVWALFGTSYNTRRWIIALFIGALGISSLLLVLEPHLRWYVGLSGLLHTLYMLGCLADVQHGRWGARALLIGIIIKLAYEQIIGPLPGSESTTGGRVLVDAHLYGAIVGAALFTGFWRFDRTAKPPEPGSG